MLPFRRGRTAVTFVVLMILGIFYPLDVAAPSKGKGGQAAPDVLPSVVKAAIHSDRCQIAAFQLELTLVEPWEEYRFGDFFKGHGNIYDFQPEKYPGSILVQYHSTGQERGDINLLRRIVARRRDTLGAEALPPANALVVHLRLGDVIDGSSDSVDAFLTSQKYYYRQDANGQCCVVPWKNPRGKPFVAEWNAYVRPLSYYSRVLERVEDPQAIVVMGSAHMGSISDGAQRVKGIEGVVKSCQYAAAIQAYLAWRYPGVNVTYRLGRTPDDDIVFASQASVYLQAGGGFSIVLGKLVRTFGGTVLN